MKKTAAVFSILFFSVMIANPSQVLAAAAQIPLPQSAGLSQATGGAQAQGTGPADTAAAETVGVACAVQGTVTAQLPGQTPRTLKSGMPVFKGELLETGTEGRLQLLLKDESAFTLGPNSRISVDEFVYDESNDNGRIQASITKGVFRFITGRIAKKTPRNMTVKLPAAVIGVRGTIVAGSIYGKSAEVILLGPGEQNNTGENPGSIYISNDQGGQEIFRAGYGTFVADEDTAPTEPELVPDSDIAEITDALSSSSEPEEQTESEEAVDQETADDSQTDSPSEADDENSDSQEESDDAQTDSFSEAGDENLDDSAGTDDSQTDAFNPDSESGEQFGFEDAAENETPETFAGQEDADTSEAASLSELETEVISTLEEIASETAQDATSDNSSENSGDSSENTSTS